MYTNTQPLRRNCTALYSNLFVFTCNQQDATLHNLFISVKCSACFRRFRRPSSGAWKLYIEHWVLCQTFTATCNCHGRDGTTSSISSMTVAGSSKGLTKCPMLYIQFWAPDDGWRNRLKHAQHFTEINKLCNIASCWLYLKIRLRCADPWTSNLVISVAVQTIGPIFKEFQEQLRGSYVRNFVSSSD